MIMEGIVAVKNSDQNKKKKCSCAE